MSLVMQDSCLRSGIIRRLRRTLKMFCLIQICETASNTKDEFARSSLISRGPLIATKLYTGRLVALERTATKGSRQQTSCAPGFHRYGTAEHHLLPWANSAP